MRAPAKSPMTQQSTIRFAFNYLQRKGREGTLLRAKTSDWPHESVQEVANVR